MRSWMQLSPIVAGLMLLAPVSGLPRGAADDYTLNSRWVLGVQVDYRAHGAILLTPPDRGTPAWGLGLEAGDWILEVDGNPINAKWTLQQAFAESNGVVDLKTWDGFNGGEQTHQGVQLMKVRVRR